ncbi:MAG: hypothetical protein AAFR58_24485 [Cyanobacteria bacterium J06627_28]
MDRLFPILLPALLGLAAGLSHGLVENYLELPTSIGEMVEQPFTGSALN